MNAEIITIVMVGVALAGVIIASIRGVRQDMARLESRLDGRIETLDGKINTMESRLSEKIVALESRINTNLGELRERMAHLEGLMEGLREAIVGRAKAS